MNTQGKGDPKIEKEMKSDAVADWDNELSDQEDKDQPIANSRRGAKRRIIDETLLDEDEARRLAQRRAYNRQCAAKARKRSKDLIATLQKQVDELSKDKASLERQAEVMKAQLQLLEQQNRTLMMNQRSNSNQMGGGAGQFFGAMQGGVQGGNFPSVLESLSAQGRLLQGDSQQGGMLHPSMGRAPAGGGGGGMDPNKYYTM
jgi:FtsZ-binding cell division protein ZapB